MSHPAHSRSLVAALAVALAVPTLLAACSTRVVPTLPGETGYAVEELTFVPEPTLPHGRLFETLAVRPAISLIPGQVYNPYREAEDTRRVVSWWKTHGHFDVTVERPTVTLDEVAKTATISWAVTEGPRYPVRSVAFKGASPEHEALLREGLTFGPGDFIEIESMRRLRHHFADVLRENGHAHAEVYSRTFVDREAKKVDWVYFVDAGPATVVGKISVAGNRKIPTAQVIDRAGLAPGDPIDMAIIRKREFDLLDTGAFINARLATTANTKWLLTAIPPDSALPPDTGGKLKAEQINAAGELVPRDLPAAIDVTIHVTESPTAQVELGAGVTVDPERIDPFATTKLQWRNALGPMHHLVVEGGVGYGVRWRGDIDEPLGLYGSALVRWLRPGLLGRLGDVRLTARFDETLYPGYHQRSGLVGLGLRTSIARGLTLNLEPRARWDVPVGFGEVSASDRDRLGLATTDDRILGEVAASIVWDARDQGFEPLDGHLISLQAAVAPGGPFGDLAYAKAELDLRYNINLSADMAIALRAMGGLSVDLGSAGVPLHARQFGGGSYGTRAFPERRLASTTAVCDDAAAGLGCRRLPVGARSLVQGSAEFRWLPYRKQVGAVAFVDVGAAGDELDPFAAGVTVAPGLGLRVRTWHIPVALDLSYRVTDVSRYRALDRFYVFLRVGEAF